MRAMVFVFLDIYSTKNFFVDIILEDYLSQNFKKIKKFNEVEFPYAFLKKEEKKIIVILENWKNKNFF